MSRFVLLTAAALSLGACAADRAGGGDVAAFSRPRETVRADENAAKIELVRRFYRAFNERSGDGLAAVLADDWRDVPLPPGQGPGLAGMQKAIPGFDAVFRDFTVTIDEIIVSGDKVVVRSTNRGVHTGNFAGLAPTGKSFEMTSIDIHTVRNGRIVETHHVEDWLGTLAQLGALPLSPGK